MKKLTKKRAKIAFIAISLAYRDRSTSNEKTSLKEIISLSCDFGHSVELTEEEIKSALNMKFKDLIMVGVNK